MAAKHGSFTIRKCGRCLQVFTSMGALKHHQCYDASEAAIAMMEADATTPLMESSDLAETNEAVDNVVVSAGGGDGGGAGGGGAGAGGSLTSMEMMARSVAYKRSTQKHRRSKSSKSPRLVRPAPNASTNTGADPSHPGRTEDGLMLEEVDISENSALEDSEILMSLVTPESSDMVLDDSVVA